MHYSRECASRLSAILKRRDADVTTAEPRLCLRMPLLFENSLFSEAINYSYVLSTLEVQVKGKVLNENYGIINLISSPRRITTICQNYSIDIELYLSHIEVTLP